MLASLVSGIKSLLSNMHEAHAEAGIDFATQLSDLMPIIVRRYNFGISDYHTYGLHSIPHEQWRAFIGWRYELTPSFILN